MTEESTTKEQRSPLASPWFIGSSVVVGLIALAGIIVATTAGGDDPAAGPTPSAPTASASPTEKVGDADASVCGLAGVETTGRVTTAPETTSWDYQDILAYPVSSTAGPGKIAPEGYRFCFQHTPKGAVFAAANAAITGFTMDSTLMDGWREYTFADGAYRADLLATDNGVQANKEAGEIRAEISGFKLLAYDGSTARVDIAFTGSSGANTVTGSGVYELIWSDGDWKINTDVREPVRVSQIPSTAGYVAWREGAAR